MFYVSWNGSHISTMAQSRIAPDTSTSITHDTEAEWITNAMYLCVDIAPSNTNLYKVTLSYALHALK